MTIDTRTQAVLLLTTWFTKPARDDPKPLTATEWSRFTQWLNGHELTLEDLILVNDPRKYLDGWSDQTVALDRITYLLERSAALGFALEKWHRIGLWVITQFDDDYPSRLRKRLGSNTPPVLFGCGNRHLLDKGGIAVIGSRDAKAKDLEFTSKLGGETALQGYSIVSGGARGVDEAAMLGALDKEGTVIGVLADGLLRKATSARYRNGLMENNLVLVSPYNPEAGFDVGNAMARNKYVYCLSDAAVVVISSKEKGGTWHGAVENLKKSWIPLWVKPDPDTNSGNAALVKQGACWLPVEPFKVDTFIAKHPQHKTKPEQTGLFDEP